jgi:hypothetical protein
MTVDALMEDGSAALDYDEEAKDEEEEMADEGQEEEEAEEIIEDDDEVKDDLNALNELYLLDITDRPEAVKYYKELKSTNGVLHYNAMEIITGMKLLRSYGIGECHYFMQV